MGFAYGRKFDYEFRTCLLHSNVCIINSLLQSTYCVILIMQCICHQDNIMCVIIVQNNILLSSFTSLNIFVAACSAYVISEACCNVVITYSWFLLSQGKAFTSIEPTETKLNDLCVVRDTGMLFLANEAPKILTYYIPVSLLFVNHYPV